MTKPQLDHIIILVPHNNLLNPTAFAEAFTLFPGGRHAGNVTENKLILLKDGVYLEIIAFIPASNSSRADHWWGKKTDGTIVDWALTSETVNTVDDASERLAWLEKGKGVGYEEPIRGGRSRPDGTIVKWDVTFPSKEAVRGAVPFWCHDVTPREFRVPLQSNPEFTNHPSGAIGVRTIDIVAPEAELGKYVDVYKAIFDAEPVEKDGKHEFQVDSPVHGLGSPVISIRAAKTEEEKKVLENNGGPGVYELVLKVDGKADRSAPQDLEEKISDGTIRIKFEAWI
jgi:hypothetical protein